MSSRLAAVEAELKAAPRTWLVTGCAGFIASNLVQRLLELGQNVRGLDDFSTGHRSNLDDVRAQAEANAKHFDFLEGDIRDAAVCARACSGVDYVLHQAAIGSVPRSIKDPVTTHTVNVDGTFNMLLAARDAKVKRFVYASSSSVYGDHPALPKVEAETGRPLSPYAVTKATNELNARSFFDSYALPTVGLRYFNVFGRRQDPEGAYAAVIPRWIARLLAGDQCVIYGDGDTSRDFCFVDNVVQANLVAALAPAEAGGQVFNIAYSARTTLKELFTLIRTELSKHAPQVAKAEVKFEPFRDGDIRHSHANIDKARKVLGYEPQFTVAQGMERTMPWYLSR
jgi:UDP-N-acetylglucosamine/UDP-N-acetylgalactosamine 4-epimerase